MVLTPNMAALVVANLELQWYITCNTTISTEFINGNAISYNVMKGHDMAPLLLTEMQCGRPFKLPCKKDISHSPVM